MGVHPHLPPTARHGHGARGAGNRTSTHTTHNRGPPAASRSLAPASTAAVPPTSQCTASSDPLSATPAALHTTTTATTGTTVPATQLRHHSRQHTATATSLGKHPDKPGTNSDHPNAHGASPGPTKIVRPPGPQQMGEDPAAHPGDNTARATAATAHTAAAATRLLRATAVDSPSGLCTTVGERPAPHPGRKPTHSE